MKKIIFFASTLILLIVTSCSLNKEVDMDELVSREGVVYKINSQEPFTGTVKRKYNRGASRYPEYPYAEEEQIAQFKNGKPNGSFVEKNKKGRIVLKTNLKDGRIDGRYESYHDNGQISQNFMAKDGRIEGRYESYHDNGQIRVITVCVDGMPTPKLKELDRNGKEETFDSFYEEGFCTHDGFRFMMNGDIYDERSSLCEPLGRYDRTIRHNALYPESLYFRNLKKCIRNNPRTTSQQ